MVTYLKPFRACSHEEFGLAAEDKLVDTIFVTLAFDDQIREYTGSVEAMGWSQYCVEDIASTKQIKERKRAIRRLVLG